MNIIIPIGGLGERFKVENYSKPKPLINSLGKPIIYWTLKNLNINKDEDTLYIVYNSLLDSFNFKNYISDNFSDINVKFIDINFNTRGAAETVLEGLNNMTEIELSHLTMVVDSDNFYDEDVVTIAKEYNDSLIFYFNDHNQNPIYSYIKLEGNVIVDIEEKNKISNNACVGAYVFKNGRILKDNIVSIISNNIKSNKKEFYISTVYKNMINNGLRVLSHKIDGFNCLGTPRQLKEVSSNVMGDEKFRFCFDLDDTLVTKPKVKNDYTTVLPIERNIKFLRFLHENGHHIIIYTARRMRTHGGNVGRVVSDIAKITLETLDNFNIPYDEIFFGKPYAHFYIDDLAINAYSDLEKETGFYDIHPKPRLCNEIVFKDTYIVKKSTNINGELYWYKNIPNQLSNLFPKLLEYNGDSITIEKIKGIPVSSIYSSKTLNEDIFQVILEKINTIHSTEIGENVNINIYGNYCEKLKKRVSNYDFSSFKDFNEIYTEVMEYLNSYEQNNLGKLGVIHGDPVFSNILIDNDNNVKFIDMRGMVGDNFTIYGDVYYDLAKVYQSIIGYDFILMDKEIDVTFIDKYKKIYEDYIMKNFGSESLTHIKYITKSLLLSLIPIHNDNKVYKYYDLIKKI